MKRHLGHGFILMFIFLLAVGAILYYSDLKFTGYDVSDGTTEETTETTEETTETTDETTEETTETTEETTETTDETTEETTETTEETTETTDETTDTDEENADINITELAQETCTPSWTCGDWGSCASGTQTRVCTDANSCDSQEGIPTMTQSCTYCGDLICDIDEDCDSCSGDCGECEEETTEEDGSDEVIPTTTFVSSNVVKTTTCTPDWTCGNWQECINSVQIRTCVDVNGCGSQEGIPATTQSCVVEIKETCFDEIKNQNEQNVDCGGVCEKKCGFFTMVGSAVSGSVEAGRKFVFEGMFGNVTKILISVGSMVLIIGAFIVARFFIGKKKGKNKLDEAIDGLSDNKNSDKDSKDGSKLEYYY